MAYKIALTKKAFKQLKSIDKMSSSIIIKWLAKNVNGCSNYKEVKSYKELRGEYQGFFRYRVGNYRILCEVQANELIIFVIAVGHRKDIYE